MKKIAILGYICLTISVLLTCCSSDGGSLFSNETPQPKPRGYFRLDLPDHRYQTMDTAAFPFTFEYSQYAQLEIGDRNDTVTKLRVYYPAQKASFDMCYYRMRDSSQFVALMQLDQQFVNMHKAVADGLSPKDLRELNAKPEVSGLFYDIQGKNVACPFHYWFTDQNRYFVHATLYFSFTPNNDSVQPVIDYLRQDAMKMVQTFDWK